jgi:hypothetical protein
MPKTYRNVLSSGSVSILARSERYYTDWTGGRRQTDPRKIPHFGERKRRAMLPTASQKFPHRHNLDGSFDSICTVCLATVAMVRREEQLYREESAHVCDLVRLYQIRQNRISAGNAHVFGFYQNAAQGSHAVVNGR